MNNQKTIIEKTAHFCEKDPYSAMVVLQTICDELQLMSISELSKIATVSKRRLYEMVEDVEFSEIEIITICKQKYIPAKLVQELLK